MLLPFQVMPKKENEPRMFGASHFFSSRNPNSLEPFSKGFDMVLVAKNVELDWDMYISTLRPFVYLALFRFNDIIYHGSAISFPHP